MMSGFRGTTQILSKACEKCQAICHFMIEWDFILDRYVSHNIKCNSCGHIEEISSKVNKVNRL